MTRTTIYAPATAPGRAAVAILRVSGPEAAAVFARLCQPQAVPDPRVATLRRIHRADGSLIDHALALWFPQPNSFTGEDVIEFHLHGGPAILKEALKALAKLPNFRPADPGEFTRRAFENGKMDLTEAEAIADLVDAETSAQLRQALRQLDGELGRLYRGWAERLTRSLALFEADIDFIDEDLPQDIAAQSLADIRALLEALDRHLDDRHRGERLREGFTVAILGPPNAGKSSLLNALSRREAAIVAPTPGTTRDIVEVQLDLGGYPVTLADTAGLRITADLVESEGIRRALRRAEQADLKLLVFDGSVWPELDYTTRTLLDDDCIVIVNKLDLIKSQLSTFQNPLEMENPKDKNARLVLPATRQATTPLFVSALNGKGLGELTERLIHDIDLRFASAGEPSLTRARHRAALEECRDHLRRALTAPQPELRAEDIRLATRALGRITGQVDVESLLDIIFSEFCIGK